MKLLLLRAAIIAIILGPLTAFGATVISLDRLTRYEPPIGPDEIQQMKKLPVEKAEALLAAREIKFTRMQWLAEVIGTSYFWKDQAQKGLVPSISIFVACIWMGVLTGRAPRGAVPPGP